MNYRDTQLYKTVVRFSKGLGVTPPQTNDIRDWWLNALQEMDEEDVCLLYENGLFKDSSLREVEIMRADLRDRYSKIQLDKEKATLREQDDF